MSLSSILRQVGLPHGAALEPSEQIVQSVPTRLEASCEAAAKFLTSVYHQRRAYRGAAGVCAMDHAIHGSGAAPQHSLRQPGLVPEISTLASHGDVSKVTDLMKVIMELRMPIDEDTMCKVLRACIKSKEFELADWHIDFMKVGGLMNKLETYNIVMNTYASSGRVCEAESWFRVMLRSGITPDGATYATLGKAWSCYGQTDRIWRLMHDADASGVPLTEYFFASVILSCGNAAPPRVSEAGRALEELIRRGLACHKVHSALVRAFGCETADALRTTVPKNHRWSARTTVRAAP